MLVIVHDLDVDEGTVVVFTGVDAESYLPVRFAADARMAQDIIYALEDGDQPIANIENWQIIG